MARPKTPRPEDLNRLKRERAGRYVTADARFAIEGGGTGSWYVVDGERLNELGLPVMDGPWATLDDARVRLDVIREGGSGRGDAAVGTSPAGPSAVGASNAEESAVGASAGGGSAVGRSAPEPSTLRPADATVPTPDLAEPEVPAPARLDEDLRARSAAAARPPAVEPTPAAPRVRRPRHPPPVPAETPAEASAAQEPAWLTRRSPADQAAARRLLATLTRLGITDTTLARREIEGNVAEVARVLFARRVRGSALGPWEDDRSAAEAIAFLGAGAPRQLRVAVASRIAAAERVLAGSGSGADAASFAWLVAVATAARIIEAIEDEGDHQRAVGDPGWRLMELDGRREPTGRPVPIGPADLAEPNLYEP